MNNKIMITLHGKKMWQRWFTMHESPFLFWMKKEACHLAHKHVSLRRVLGSQKNVSQFQLQSKVTIIKSVKSFFMHFIHAFLQRVTRALNLNGICNDLFAKIVRNCGSRVERVCAMAGPFRQHILITHSTVSAYCMYLLVFFWTTPLEKNSWFYASLGNKTKWVNDVNHTRHDRGPGRDLSTTNYSVPIWQRSQNTSTAITQKLGFRLYDLWPLKNFFMPFFSPSKTKEMYTSVKAQKTANRWVWFAFHLIVIVILVLIQTFFCQLNYRNMMKILQKEWKYLFVSEEVYSRHPICK